MSNALGTSTSVMINRIATREGASANTLLAQVAKMRGEMALTQSKAKPEALPDIVRNPINGAEVDLIV
ncbi:hypothetical protein JP75_22215 [Devosia riboflavina]|uniref:Uncharacterized protein n=1 Tax=Devosia riboflavina TaxID=46914 RepID=A0A087LXD6_9HYPH|nr:hypothetical protein [Devosia riboflavina]KFL29289.1 hypothetical protein JP75_22215 [Devosia riboflavina]